MELKRPESIPEHVWSDFQKEEIHFFEGKKYINKNFIEDNHKGLTACDLCSFELGKCQRQILSMGQCYIPDIVNKYYLEVKNSD